MLSSEKVFKATSLKACLANRQMVIIESADGHRLPGPKHQVFTREAFKVSLNYSAAREQAFSSRPIGQTMTL